MTVPSPEVRAIMDLCSANFPPLGTEMTDIADVRAFFAARPAPARVPLPLAHVADEDADGVPVRVYDPSLREDAPVVLFCHGGGFVICDLDSHDDFCRAMAKATGAVVVSVDYRRAPEHRFPAAPEDAYTALLWAAKMYQDRPIAVAGDSAGGNLATVLTLLSRDRGGPEIVFQALYYPMLDPTRSGASHRDNAEGYFLTADHVRWFWEQYLTTDADAANPYAAPLGHADLTGLPPAQVISPGLDPLCSDGDAYAVALAEAGVPVVTRRYDGMFHGFLSMGAALPEVAEACDEAFAVLKARLTEAAAG
ncbi:alpha/beta hydrolase [Streptomyces sp. NPDC058067]|uniref:alpha/beta hydrolase n=1 Tax=Streptomyces sp. NPDC058067 TaxID=3346324 RepID=UPI0036E02339